MFNKTELTYFILERSGLIKEGINTEFNISRRRRLLKEYRERFIDG